MKILVLGGNGFIGSHIVDALLMAGHEVTVYDRGPEVWRKPILDVNYHTGNFSDSEKLANALVGIDAVVHLISTSVPSVSNLDPIADVEGNLINTIKLLQLMRASNVNRIIYLSSGGTVYGRPTVSSVPETHSLNPICSYGVVKVAIENYLGVFSELYGLEALIIRPSNVYGPRQSLIKAQGAIPVFLRKILNRQTLQIWGDGTVKRDFLYVSDLARLCQMAFETNKTGIFNAGSGYALSLNEVIHLIEVETKLMAQVEYQESRSFDVKEIALDISKAKAMFDWHPTTSISDGIAQTHAWGLENRHVSD